VPILEALRRAFPQLSETERVGGGCPACYGGYVGRLPIGELLVIDDKISGKITEQVTALDIQRLSLAPRLLENGIEQVISGCTTMSEVLREALWTGGADTARSP